MTLKINVDKSGSWKVFTCTEGVLLIKGDFHGNAHKLCLKLSVSSSKGVRNCVEGISNNYALIFYNNNKCIVLVDKIRSFPVYYLKNKGIWHISASPSYLIKKKNKILANDIAALSLAMSGYTVGDSTLYKSMFSLIAGQFIIFDKSNNVKKYHHYKYIPIETDKKDIKSLILKLSQVTLKVLSKIVKEAEGRQLVVPLSAGNDSRLIASGFKHLGYKNVKCYSYGFKGDYESEYSRKISEKLGYEWKFIELKYFSEKSFYRSNEYKEYLNYSDTYSSVQVTRWLSGVKYLKESGWIDNDAIFINGNSGDFISGGHIPVTDIDNIANKNYSDQKRLDAVLNLFIKKHFGLWGGIASSYNIVVIKKLLLDEAVKLDKALILAGNECALYESLEFYHRQTKYVVTSQRIYEFYGFEWRLPLWDSEYLTFWSRVPVVFKKKQFLYKKMLNENNWGDVWNIKVNNENIRPIWILPIRLAVKFALSLFPRSKNKWHELELRFFKYWMDNGRVTLAYKYSDFFQQRRFRSVASIAVKKYLNDKNIKL
ncbi:asparagine synthase [bacterium]|jgi:asparagine synthase (glutamine-hydrolysing)|nr:asparagine synthase [bacterium]